MIRLSLNLPLQLFRLMSSLCDELQTSGGEEGGDGGKRKGEDRSEEGRGHEWRLGEDRRGLGIKAPVK